MTKATQADLVALVVRIAGVPANRRGRRLVSLVLKEHRDGKTRMYATFRTTEEDKGWHEPAP